MMVFFIFHYDVALDYDDIADKNVNAVYDIDNVTHDSDKIAADNDDFWR